MELKITNVFNDTSDQDGDLEVVVKKPETKSIKDIEEEQKRAKAKEQLQSDIWLVVSLVIILIITGIIITVKV